MGASRHGSEPEVTVARRPPDGDLQFTMTHHERNRNWKVWKQ